MNLATGLIALAFLGAPEPRTGPEPLISYEMTFLEMKGLDWRSKQHETLSVVSRQGQATVWTASRQVAKELTKSAQKVLATPRVSAAPESEAAFEHENVISYILDMKRVADGPLNHATAVAYRPEIERLRDHVRCSVSGQGLDQGTLAHVEVDQAAFLGFHVYPVGETVQNAQTGPRPLVGTVQVPIVAQGRVEGDWLIPVDGALVVGLGPYLMQNNAEKPEVCERIVLIEARKVADESLSGPAQGIPGSAPRPLPPMPIGRSRPGPPPIEQFLKPALSPPPAFALATPQPPSRALPTALAKDGTVFELPPLPEEFPPSHEPSAEVRPAAQMPTTRPTSTTPANSPNSPLGLLTNSVAATASAPTAVPGSSSEVVDLRKRLAIQGSPKRSEDCPLDQTVMGGSRPLAAASHGNSSVMIVWTSPRVPILVAMPIASGRSGSMGADTRDSQAVSVSFEAEAAKQTVPNDQIQLASGFLLKIRLISPETDAVCEDAMCVPTSE